MSGKMSRVLGPRWPRAQEDPNIYYYKIGVSFVKEILSYRSTFRHKIEKSSSLRELADLLITNNHYMTFCFPEVCTAFLLFVIIALTTASARAIIFKNKIDKNLYKKGYAT